MKLTIDAEENPLDLSDIKEISKRMAENTGIFLWECLKRKQDPRAEMLRIWLESEVA